MEESILISIKKLLGLSKEYKVFDTDIIMHINSVFMTLRQLGVGPEKVFRIEDDSAIWLDYIDDSEQLDSVITYIYLKVKMVFDPPTTSALIAANQQMINELEWRLNAEVESK